VFIHNDGDLEVHSLNSSFCQFTSSTQSAQNIHKMSHRLDGSVDKTTSDIVDDGSLSDFSAHTESVVDLGLVITMSCLGRDPRRSEHVKILQIDLNILYWRGWCGDDKVLIAGSCLLYTASIWRIARRVPNKGREFDWGIMMAHLTFVVVVELSVFAF